VPPLSRAPAPMTTHPAAPARGVSVDTNREDAGRKPPVLGNVS
jgi:hypothetical protein